MAKRNQQRRAQAATDTNPGANVTREVTPVLGIQPTREDTSTSASNGLTSNPVQNPDTTTNAPLTYAQIVSRPPSPSGIVSRPPSPVVRPNTPTNSDDIIQSVRHSIHAPPNEGHALATPDEIVGNGYPEEGFTLVSRKSKGKGRADNNTFFSAGQGMAAPSGAVPFLRNAPRPIVQGSTTAANVQTENETTQSEPMQAEPTQTETPMLPVPTVSEPTAGHDVPVSTPEPSQNHPQTGPSTAMPVDPETMSPSAPQAETRKRKRARVESAADDDSQLAPSESGPPTWDAGAPDVPMGASEDLTQTHEAPPPLSVTGAEIAMALAAVEHARRQVEQQNGTLSERTQTLPSFTRTPQPAASTSRTTLEHQSTDVASSPPPPPVQSVPLPQPVLTPQGTQPLTQNPPPLNFQFNPINNPPNPNPLPNAYNQGVVAVPPAGGYPDIYGFHAGNLFEGQAPQQLAMWNQIYNQRGGLLMRMYDPAQDSVAVTQRMTSALRDLLPNHVSPTVAPPERDSNHHGRSPVHFFVTDMDPAAIQLVLQRRIVNTSHGTFIAIPYHPQTPDSFVTTIQRHTFTEAHFMEVLQAFRNQLQSEQPVLHFIATHRDAFPLHYTPDMAINAVLNSMRVQSIPMGQHGGTPRLYWNLFLSPPTRHIPHYTEWVDLIRSIVFRTALYGTGTSIETPFRCPRCGGRDHPAGHCPLPQVQGWINPPVNISTPRRERVNPTSQREQGGTPRGRGNQRGRGNRRGRGY
ncbi:hypothetical protein K435DRAFT_907297 [Dendrothele bispora CBS 962.96]|uniref:Uncharacterized protein n=1 Tax=Dendrothele bispora (strain CBS 962.96) TaxID=1314807 RepID=A0A4S8LRW6_DENBC|nr:hypothetical protein K435DRAFT_907297 [Dendrothele bispora CBS 962.96]